MSHEIESMFYRGETPWHGLGQAVKGAVTTRAAIVAAGLDWHVSLVSLATECGLQSDHRLAVRDTDRRPLGTVGPGYTVLQNREAFDSFDPLVSRGVLDLETAGSLRDGRRVWILARVGSVGGDRDRVSADDRVSRFVLLAHAHDGSLAVRAGLTAVRVVCANTLAASLNAKDGGLVSIRHTASVRDRVDGLMAALESANCAVDKTMERYRAMRKIVVRNPAQVSAYLAAVLGESEAKRQAEARKKGKQTPIEKAVRMLHDAGRGTDLPGVKFTAWGVYNALTEYLTHVQGRGKDQRRNAENRADRNAWGAGAALLSRAASDEALLALQLKVSADSAAKRGIPIDDVMTTITSRRA